MFRSGKQRASAKCCHASFWLTTRLGVASAFLSMSDNSYGCTGCDGLKDLTCGSGNGCWDSLDILSPFSFLFSRAGIVHPIAQQPRETCQYHHCCCSFEEQIQLDVCTRRQTHVKSRADVYLGTNKDTTRGYHIVPRRTPRLPGQ